MNNIFLIKIKVLPSYIFHIGDDPLSRLLIKRIPFKNMKINLIFSNYLMGSE